MINTGSSSSLPAFSDNPNRWKAGTYTASGDHVVAYDTYTQQNTWVERMAGSLTSLEAKEIALDPPIGGSSSLRDLLTELRNAQVAANTTTTAELDFTDGVLSANGLLTITPTTAGKYSDVVIADPNGQAVDPDSIVIANNNIIVGMDTFRPLQGIWKATYSIKLAL